MKRRSLLKYGIAGSALLAVGGIGLSIRPTVLSQPSRPLAVFNEVEFSILSAIANRITPQVNHYPSARQFQVAERIDDFMAISNPENVKELKQVLHLIENALVSTLMGGPSTPFTGLSSEQQDRVLKSWRDSRLSLRKTAFNALRGLCLSTYFSHPEAYALVGYPGPPDFSRMMIDEPLIKAVRP